MSVINNKLYIIPNEDILKTGIFFRILRKDEKHLKYINEFSSINNLVYSFTDDDSNIAPRMLAVDGHLVVKTSWDFINISVFYVPEKITENQKIWLDDNLGNFKDFEYLGFNNYNITNNKITEDKVEDLEKELLEIDKRYDKYKKSKEDNKHVR